MKTVLSNIALGNPIPEDLPIDSDFLSENTIAFNDFETSSPIPLELTTQTPDASDPTSLQPLDSSAPPPDTIQLFADSTDTPLQTSLFAESSNGLPENSCEAAGGDFQPYSKRDDGQSCTPKARVDPLPLLSLPDLDNLEEVVGSGQGETQKRRAFNIPPIPGYTVDDDKFCPTPKRRLCCQGPPSTTFVQVWEIVNDCRGMMKPSVFFSFFFFSLVLCFPLILRRREVAVSPDSDKY